MTDSSCDLDRNKVEEFNLEVVPLTYEIDGEIFADDYKTSTPASMHIFYDKIRAGKISKTAQPSPGAFMKRMENYLKKGLDILYLGFSSALSGTYNAFNLAKKEMQKKFPTRKIYGVDTLCASLGQGLLISYAAGNQKASMSIDKNYEWVEKHKLKLAHYFTIDDLSVLKRGGRLSPGKALIASVLMIKPMLHVDNEGRLVPVGRAYGRKNSLRSLVQGMARNIVKPREQEIYICHADCLDEAREVARMVEEQYHPKKIYINTVGPVIGSHCGPGTISVFYMATAR